MSILDTLNSNTPPDTIILNPKYLNFDFIVNKIIGMFDFMGSTDFTHALNSSKVLNVIYILFSIFSTFLIFVITYSVIRIFEVRKREHHHLEEEIHEYIEKHSHDKDADKIKVKDKRWAQVFEYVISQNPGDWKLAILEADLMLEDLMEQLGFKGETLGEKLKGANRDNFKSLTSAWEVHIIRNKIAHEGSDFELSQHEAKRVISLYEEIFREFDFI